MDLAEISGLEFSLDAFILMLQTTGINFAFGLGKAVVIFYVGKFLVRLLLRAVSKIMHKQEVDAMFPGRVGRALHEYGCELEARWGGIHF